MWLPHQGFMTFWVFYLSFLAGQPLWQGFSQPLCAYPVLPKVGQLLPGARDQWNWDLLPCAPLWVLTLYSRFSNPVRLPPLPHDVLEPQFPHPGNQADGQWDNIYKGVECTYVCRIRADHGIC